MAPEGRSLWATLPGQRLLQLLLRGPIDAETRKRFRWILDELRKTARIRTAREPRQLSLFYPEPPIIDQPWPCAVERPTRLTGR